MSDTTPPPLRVWLFVALAVGALVVLAGVAKLVFDIPLDLLD
jgi:hypothetical protein